MRHNDSNARPEPCGQTASPRCADCHIAMRHSCTEETETGGERRIYECVKCASTQSVETAAA
jgi:hypothetical protein